jgi:hypothetical protein
LAEELLATVHETDDEVEMAWDEEIRRRIADIAIRLSKAVPFSQHERIYLKQKMPKTLILMVLSIKNSQK